MAEAVAKAELFKSSVTATFALPTGLPEPLTIATCMLILVLFTPELE